MNCKLRKMLFILLMAIFLCTGGLLISRLVDAHSAAKTNNLAQTLANVPTDTIPPESIHAAETPYTDPTESIQETTLPTEEELPDANALRLLNWDIASLQEVNPEVIGWILLPDTQINYPLLHTKDNETYLNTAWDGSYSVSGSIFLETRNDPALSDYNTLIYGHNMRNGSMFAPLMGYKDAQFLEANPNIYIATADSVHRYTVFAAYEASVVSDTYRLIFNSPARKQLALNSYLERSQWEPPLTPTIRDHILTLSTCTGTGQYETRWVVQAVRTGSWDNEKAGFPQETSFQDEIISPQEP